nr:SDR family NAD(P)-dependent oxidoreductase [Oceanococcus sp. HetDA_MAG_MS8]
MTERIKNRHIVITGASSGIGRATAMRLADAGANLHLIARREEELQAVVEAIRMRGGQAEYSVLDLSDATAVDDWLQQWKDRGAVCDVLVNNAGRSIRRGIRESLQRMHDFERCMQLNYFAAVRLSLGLLPGMLERKSGHLVNISTWGTLMPAPRFAAYAASKSALDAFSHSVGSELRHAGVAVTTVHFPIVKTPMIAPTKVYARLPGLSPEQAASWIEKAIRKRPARIAPPYATLFGLQHTFLPRLTQRVADLAKL